MILKLLFGLDRSDPAYYYKKWYWYNWFVVRVLKINHENTVEDYKLYHIFKNNIELDDAKRNRCPEADARFREISDRFYAYYAAKKKNK